MARGRMIDKRIAYSKKLAALKWGRSRVLYFMILPHLDCEGRSTGDPDEIKIDCVPKLTFTPKQIAESIIDLANVGLLTLYSHSGAAFIQYSRFADFQIGLRKEKESASRIPPPQKSRTNDGLPPSWSGLSLSLSLRKEGKGRNTTEQIDFSFPERKFLNIKIEDKAGWKDAYPAVDIDQEIRIAREWLLANPTRAKSNYRQFLNNWFRREQQKGGSQRFKRAEGGRPMTRKEERKEKIKKWTEKPEEK